jgi:NAD(P)-dependent dehydrogenase (short-subunit alcohol dehydrogenase family)
MSADIPGQPRDLPILLTKEAAAGGTYIVTGANTGLGFEAAKHLVRLGAAKVILAVRRPANGETARAEIDAATGTSGIAEVWPLDLSSYDSVKSFAARIENELERVDAVIENAAVVTGQRILAEGHILPLTVNVFGTFLLAMLLLPKLKESAEKFGTLPRLSVITSGSAFDVRESWEAIREDPFRKLEEVGAERSMVSYVSPCMLYTHWLVLIMLTLLLHRYPISKLMDTLITRELASLLPVEKGKVVINASCPGLCITELDRNLTGTFKEELGKLREASGRTAEEGSRTLLAGVALGKESHGRYMTNCKINE